MNAPALNPAASPATAPVGSTGSAGVAGQAVGPLAGFEALLSALFPQGATVATSALAGSSGKSESGDAANENPDETAVDILAPDAAPVSGDANAALLASTLAGQPVIAANPIATPSAEPGAAPGREPTKGVSAAPAFFGSDPKAAAQDAEVRTDQPSELPDVGIKTASNPPPPSAESSRPTLAQGPRAAGPSSAPAAGLPDPAIAAPVAATTDATLPEIAPTATAAANPTAASALPSAAGLVARQEPTPAAPSRTARSDRNRATSEARPGDEAKSAPVGETVTTASVAKPVSSAARASEAGPEKAEAADRDVEVAADAPDATLQGETRASASALTPAALGTHGVRGSPETVATLAAQIIKKLEGQSTRFDLELNPAGLGKVDVRIDIGAHGRVSAAMMFDNPQAAADLRARATELQRMLEQAGFDMSGGLSFDVAGDRGQQQRQAWQDQNDNAGHAFRGQAFRAALDTAGNATDAAIGGALRLRRGVNAGLDLRI